MNTAPGPPRASRRYLYAEHREAPSTSGSGARAPSIQPSPPAPRPASARPTRPTVKATRVTPSLALSMRGNFCLSAAGKGKPLPYAICCPSSPPRNARRARTSDTYWRPSSSGTRCRRSLSVGSLIQPWMGMALSVFPVSHGRAARGEVATRPRGTCSSGGCCPES